SSILHSIVLSYLFLSFSADHRDLHSFPTRRSSDLGGGYTHCPELACFYLRDHQQTAPAGEPGLFHQPIALDRSGHDLPAGTVARDRKSTRLNSSHEWISYAVFCLKKKKYKKCVSMQ